MEGNPPLKKLSVEGTREAQVQRAWADLLETTNLEAIYLSCYQSGVESLPKEGLLGVLAWWGPHGSPVLWEIGWHIPL